MPTTFAAASTEAASLRDSARDASTRAYVPYSHFHVGAALRFADGTVVTGCNVENASFGLTICAERAAFARAVSEGRDTSEIELVAIHVEGPEGQPCGMCRQVMLELAPNARVAFPSGGEYVETDVRELLPSAFVPGALDQ